MAHLSGHCECGRRIHFPKTATYGYRWTCHRCGRSYTLSKQGDPLHRTRSRKPPASGPTRPKEPDFIWAPWMTKAAVLTGVYLVFGGTGVMVTVGGWVWLKTR